MRLKFDDRDDRHEWWLNGRRASGISGLGKTIDNTYNLEQWSMRMTMIGTALRPDIAEMALAHHDDKDQLTRLVEQAKNHAKANEGANKGTAKHRISERIDLGEDTLLSPTMQEFANAYKATLAEHGLVVLPDYVERAVVWPDEMWVGRYDRIYGLTTPCPTCGGTKRGADLKSGENAVKYPHSVAIQLTGYVFAPLTAVLLPAGKQVWESSEFVPHPDDLCKCKGIVMHAPADGTVGAWEIDLVPDMLDLVRKVKAWQKVKGDTIVRPMVATPVPPAEVAAGGSPPAPARTPYVVPGATESAPVWTAKPSEEGGEVDAKTVGRLTAGFARRSDSQKAIVTALLKQAQRAGVEFGQVAKNPTRRRFELGRAALWIVDHCTWGDLDKPSTLDEDLVRAAMRLVIGDLPPVEHAPLGALLGTFTADEAASLCLVLDGITAGTYVADYSTNSLLLRRAS